ncbi:hypothetical protein [Thalassiella azotivora]
MSTSASRPPLRLVRDDVPEPPVPVGRDRWLSPQEAAEQVGVEPHVLESWALQGGLERREVDGRPEYESPSVAELVVRLKAARCAQGHRLVLRRDGSQVCVRCAG